MSVTTQSNHDIRPRKTRNVGDQSIFFGMHNSPYWKTMWLKSHKEAFFLLLGYYLKFNKAMLAFQHWALLRFKPGVHTTGLLLTLASVISLLGYNSSHIHVALKPFSLFIVPFAPFFKEPEEFYDLIFTDIESEFLLVYTIIFTAMALVHNVTLWIGKGNESITKRGESWIYHGLSKLFPVNEYLICGMIEPAITIGLGVLAWHFANDYYFMVFTIVVALSEASQQLLDKSYQSQIQSILRA